MMNHGKYYCCKRLRMLDYLRKQGFEPESKGTDWNNPKYSVWYFLNSPELEEAISEYIKMVKKNY